MTILNSGQQFAGRYRVESMLGSGGFGRVYAAHDIRLERDIALKIVNAPAGVPDVTSYLDGQLREARAAARLDHPHIVQVYDAGVAGTSLWITMRLVRGHSLATVLRDRGKLGFAEAARLLEPVARALDHAHQRGIVHRDVKPTNIMVETPQGDESHVWLLDFGVAKIITGETSWTEPRIAGTPSYMAPEQITGKRVDGRADIFALGCVLCETLTGKRAFVGDSYSQIVYRIVHESPDGLADVQRTGGKALHDLLQRSLAKSPLDRYSSAADFATELAKILAPSRRRTVVTVLRDWSRRRAAVWDGNHALSTRGLKKSYEFRKPVLRGVDLDVPAGAIFALLGRNGEGKTTLLRTGMGFDRLDAGTSRVFGRDPRKETTAALRRVGYVAEDLTAYAGLRVDDFFGLSRSFYPSWNRAFHYHLLERFNLPLDLSLKKLSRGMRTKVSLVAALSHRPDFLVLDDPTVGLDAVVLKEFFDTLREVTRREGTTVLITSHNIDEVETLATHVAILHGGKIQISSCLNVLLDRAHEITLRPRPGKQLRLDGTVSVTETAGDTVTLVTFDLDSGQRAHLESISSDPLIEQRPSLKQVFVALLGDAEGEREP